MNTVIYDKTRTTHPMSAMGKGRGKIAEYGITEYKSFHRGGERRAGHTTGDLSRHTKGDSSRHTKGVISRHTKGDLFHVCPTPAAAAARAAPRLAVLAALVPPAAAAAAGAAP